jgi:hypothetical protein
MNSQINYHGAEHVSERTRGSGGGGRRWLGQARARVALSFIAALALLLGSVPQRAAAHAAVVDCGIQVVVSDMLATGGFGDTPDFYTKFRVNGAEQTTEIIADAAHITPSWKFETGIACSALVGRSVPIDIEPWDDDLPWSDDDLVDVDPGAVKPLYLTINFIDLFTSGVAGRLRNRLTGADLGVFRMVSSAGGRITSWESMPAAGPFRAPLVSAGTGAESARLTYKIIVISEPDFTISRVTSDPTGTRTRVFLNNLGGPGVLTNVGCSNLSSA